MDYNFSFNGEYGFVSSWFAVLGDSVKLISDFFSYWSQVNITLAIAVERFVLIVYATSSESILSKNRRLKFYIFTILSIFIPSVFRIAINSDYLKQHKQVRLGVLQLIVPPKIYIHPKQPHTHKHTHAHVHKHTHTHTQTHKHTHKHAQTKTHKHTHTQTNTNTICTHTSTYTHTQTHTHIRTQTHTHTHTHTQHTNTHTHHIETLTPTNTGLKSTSYCWASRSIMAMINTTQFLFLYRGTLSSKRNETKEHS